MLLATTTESSQRRSLSGPHWLWFTSGHRPACPYCLPGGH